ncbi:MAG: hypothetical protein JWQ44_2062 [Chthoniobacter sp.]|nr:hypothetical protein [Chthoniobacter sp.]
MLTLEPVKRALSNVVASVSLWSVGFSQEAPLPGPEPVVQGFGGESLGDSLLVSEPVQEDAAPLAAEPVLAVEGAGDSARRGRWRFAPQLNASATYDDNIFIQAKDQVADYIFTLAPGVAFGFWDFDEDQARSRDVRRTGPIWEQSSGNHLAVQYTALLLGFARTRSQNTLDHDGRISARWEREKLTLGATLHLESKSETNTDVGDRIRRKTSTAVVTSSYQLTGKTALGLEFSNRINEPENYARTVEWRAESSMDYSVTPLVRVGLGAALGQVQVQAGGDHVFERLLARATYSLGEKLEAEFRGGVEFRQSPEPADDRTNPIFAARAAWLPGARTDVGIETYRRLETSIEQPDRSYTSTGVALSLRQGFSGSAHLDLVSGYQVASYTEEFGADEREDRYLFVRPGLWYHFATWGSAGLIYEHRRNSSNREESEFANNQTTVQFSLSY